MAKRKTQEAAPAKGKNTQTQTLVYIIVFVAGFLAGVGFTIFKSDPSTGVQNVSQQQAAQQDTNQQLLNLEAEVTADPGNFQAWVQLGHAYYDSNQPEKAIKAYTKSLELHSGDANLLTDLGVMYRRTGQPDKAVELFDQAIARDPKHLVSRFNKGIVLFYDKQDKTAAFAAWEDLLSVDPNAKAANGEPIRAFVDRLKAESQ
jgi:cytochrome c-type biogenesis protein CcmH/NrfG